MSFFTGLFGSSAFAIDVSDRSLRLLALSGKATGKQIQSFSSVDVPEGLIQRAEIKDQEAVSELLRTLVERAKPKKPKRNDVVAGVPEAQVYSMHVTAPAEMTGEELDQLVLKKAMTMLPFTLETIAWDYTVLSKNETEHDILFAAVRKEIVEGYANTFTLAGLDLVALEPESTSLVRALVTKDLVQEGKGVAVVDIGGRGTRMVFADEVGQQLAVSKAVGGMLVTAELAKKKKISEKQAEKLKRKDGMKGVIGEIAEKVYTPVIEEFLSAREYYELKTKRKVDQVILSGGAGRMKGLQAFFQDGWGLPVVVSEGRFSKEEKAPDVTAILTGLALRGHNPKSGLSFVIPD